MGRANHKSDQKVQVVCGRCARCFSDHLTTHRESLLVSETLVEVNALEGLSLAQFVLATKYGWAPVI